MKGPCLVLVIESQVRWTNSVYVRYTGDQSIGEYEIMEELIAYET